MSRRSPSVLAQTVGAFLLLAGSTFAGGVGLGFKGGMALSRLPMDHTYFVESARFPELWDAFTDDFASRYRTGRILGTYVTVPLSDRLGLQAEVLWVKRGGTVEGKTHEPSSDALFYFALNETVELEYLEIPLLLKIRGFDLGPFGTRYLIGPYAGARMRGVHSVALLETGSPPRSPALYGEEFETSVTNFGSRYDYGLVFGMELSWSTRSDRIFIDIRYVLGLRSEFEDAEAPSITYQSYENLFYPRYRAKRSAINDARTGDASGFKNRSFYLTVGFSFIGSCRD